MPFKSYSSCSATHAKTEQYQNNKCLELVLRMREIEYMYWIAVKK